MQNDLGLLRVEADGSVLSGPRASVHLSRTLRNLLLLLAANNGRLVRYETILASVWEIDRPIPEDLPLVHDAVSRLRRTLQTVGAEDEIIRTVYGLGYRLEHLSTVPGGGSLDVQTVA